MDIWIRSFLGHPDSVPDPQQWFYCKFYVVDDRQLPGYTAEDTRGGAISGRTVNLIHRVYYNLLMPLGLRWYFGCIMLGSTILCSMIWLCASYCVLTLLGSITLCPGIAWKHHILCHSIAWKHCIVSQNSLEASYYVPYLDLEAKSIYIGRQEELWGK